MDDDGVVTLKAITNLPQSALERGSVNSMDTCPGVDVSGV